MVIRSATEADIPQIILLMKMSLGESLMQKTENYWRWKHIENPFGASLVLLAEEENQIIGLRAFMRWTWRMQDKKIEAVRAVDTATHPSFQGKGIFSKLTRTALVECDKLGYNFVFNTPNQKSLPGYLKMGWEKSGKAPLTFRMRPFQIVRGILRSPSNEPFNDSSVKYFVNHKTLPELLTKSEKTFDSKFITPHTASSLSWRYEKVPVAKYYAAGIENEGQLDGVFFYRLKKSQLGVELRISDAFVSQAKFLKPLQSILKNKMSEHQASYAVISALRQNEVLRGPFAFSQNRFGPIVTLREIGGFNLENFRSFNAWSPSIGDLELF